MSMGRRKFIGFVASVTASSAVWPTGTRGQQSVPVVGYLDTATATATAHLMAEFHRGLRDAGYIEGQNVAIEYRLADGDPYKLPGFAAELVQRQVAVIAAINTPSVLAAKAATRTTPIVFGTGLDPIKAGLVMSLNRPGGNLTGVTQLNNEMEAKRVQMLHELAPGSNTIAILVNPTNRSYTEAATEAARIAADVVGVHLLVLNASTPEEIAAAFSELVKQRVGLLLVSGDSVLVSLRNEIVAQSVRHAVPALYHRRECVVAGGLMSFGPSLAEAYYQVGEYVGRILKGDKPADLPVQQPTKFELVINAKAAKGLGLSIPQSILLRADEVIE